MSTREGPKRFAVLPMPKRTQKFTENYESTVSGNRVRARIHYNTIVAAMGNVRVYGRNICQFTHSVNICENQVLGWDVNKRVQS